MLTTIPGFTGFKYARLSSMDKRAIGKFTDVNHLSAFHDTDPVDYDKKIISLYTQSSLYSNDFLNMINQSTPYYVEGISDTWKWKVNVPYKFPKIIEVPEDVLAQSRVGIDGKEFSLIIDTREFAQNSIISVGSRIWGPKIFAIEDATEYNDAYIQRFTLISENPKIDFVNKQWLAAGKELELIDGSIGEFDQNLLGLPRSGDTIQLYDSMGAAYGFEHTITGWADDVQLKDAQGRPKDLLMFVDQRRNELPTTRNSVRWEPLIEFELRRAMLELKVKKMIWSKPGTTRTRGSKQELKKVSAGVYHRMRHNGNLVQYNRGEFSPNLLRSVFGDLFYRRVDVKDRRVKLYTNEAGFDVFQQAVKQDAINSGLQLVADSGDRYIQGQGQRLVYNWAFEAMVTRETGRVDLIHLRELDLPQTSDDFGQNKKSTPIFMVFDVSPNGDGSMRENIREVRKAGRPSMTWGYIDGRRHHLGFAKSQGHSAANKFDGYTLFFDDRCDVFIEDLSRCVLIEELPQY